MGLGSSSLDLPWAGPELLAYPDGQERDQPVGHSVLTMTVWQHSGRIGDDKLSPCDRMSMTKAE